MALRKIDTKKANNKRAVILKDTEWQEYRVRFYRGINYQIDADYHTDDILDALQTADYFVNTDGA